MTNLGDQRKMTTPVRCIFDANVADVSDTKYILVGFCHENLVADFKIDTGRAVALITNVELIESGESELAAEFVMTVIADDAVSTRTALELQGHAAHAA